MTVWCCILYCDTAIFVQGNPCVVLAVVSLPLHAYDPQEYIAITTQSDIYMYVSRLGQLLLKSIIAIFGMVYDQIVKMEVVCMRCSVHLQCYDTDMGISLISYTCTCSYTLIAVDYLCTNFTCR